LTNTTTTKKSAAKTPAKSTTKKTANKSLADIAKRLKATKKASSTKKKTTKKAAPKRQTTSSFPERTVVKKPAPMVEAFDIKSAFRTPKKKTTEEATQSVATTTKKASAKKSDLGLDFIGKFPMRKSGGDKKLDNKKASTGPIFEMGHYKVASYNTPLSQAYIEEFKANYSLKHTKDTFDFKYEKFAGEGEDPAAYTRDMLERVASGEFDMLVLNMKDFPLDLPAGLTIATSFKREDPRDVLVSRSTYGAIQELPREAKIAANSMRRVMQIRALRPDLEVTPCHGDIHERLQMIDTHESDALVVSWSSLRRLNISPRYYVSLQADLMVPAPCQGTVGVVCREDDISAFSKLAYVEDSEASWSSRCERAFLQKMGGKTGAPIGALAHRKGTQDPWILDIAVGDPKSGELLKHREIGTSRCKPESLADKAFAGVLGKGARRFMIL